MNIIQIIKPENPGKRFSRKKIYTKGIYQAVYAPLSEIRHKRPNIRDG